MKTRLDNNVINHISLFYIETETELLGPIYPDVVCDENQI